MALKLSCKIGRFLKINKVKTYVNRSKTFSRQNSKRKYVNQLDKTASTLTQNQIKQGHGKYYIEEDTPIQLNEIPVVIPSELKNVDMTIRRKFAKSSTQIAITQPLKLPRLANPFPEPVKTLPSDTVSDEEKSRLMHEQVKMEARFHLQQQQEKLLEQKLKKMSLEQNVELNNSKVAYEDFEQQQQINVPHQYQRINYQKNQQPNYRKPKEYSELQYVEQEKCKNSPRKVAINTTEKNENDVKTRRPRHTRCRKRSHTRAARYLRHSWVPRHVRKQVREYSTSINSKAISPDMMTDSEQCDLIIKRLKSLYPEYENLKKPLLLPGSQEEKDFIKDILKLIGKHKTEVAKKIPAPFPSYSEVKTFPHTNKKNNNNVTTDIVFNPGSQTRFYSTKSKVAPIILNKPVKKIKKFKFKHSKLVNNLKPKKVLKKQEAPHSSYSDLNKKQLIFNNFDCSINNPSKQTPVYGNSRFYSTGKLEKQVKKKPPCKNPFPPIPECDYVGQAIKNKENKRKKQSPKTKKKSSSEVDCSRIISKIKAWLSTYKPEAENIKISRSDNDPEGRESYVIEVSEYQEINSKEQNGITKEENEIVQIIQPPPHKFNVYPGTKKAPFRNLEYKPIEFKETHAPEMTDPVIVQSKNIPDFVSDTEVRRTKPEALKLNDTKSAEVKEKVKINAKEIKIDECNDIKFTGINSKIINKPKAIKMNKIQQILKTKINTDIGQVNKVKNHLTSKLKKGPENEVWKKIKIQEEYIPEKPKNFKMMNVKNNISNKYKDFKVNDMKSTFPEPCPIVSRSFSDCYTPSNCPGSPKAPPCPPSNKDKKEPPYSRSKCRPRKKKKLPNCDDLKNKKSMPFFIPDLDQSPENKNSHKKTYFKKSDNISNYIDLKSKKLEMLPNENKESEPFKLKQQFWKRLNHN